MAGTAKKKSKTVEIEKLPENWSELPIEKKYRLVNEKLHNLADIDCDWDIDIKLCTYDEDDDDDDDDSYYSYIEWTDAGCVWDADCAEYKPCQFTRKKPVAPGKITLTDFPPELQEGLKEEDWTGKDDYDIPNIIDSRVVGKDWSECLAKTFIRLELLKLGYEMCWECEDYRKDHRKFFEKYFKEQEEIYGGGDDDDEEDDDSIHIFDEIDAEFEKKSRKK